MATAVERYNARLVSKTRFGANGLWFPGTDDRHAQIRSLKLRPDDTAIVCYPKCGTHWMYGILTYINTDGDLTKATHHPFLPLEVGPPSAPKSPIQMFEEAPSPRIFATHLPFELCPDELHAGKGKIILIIRNPKDVVVSHFHFHKFLKEVGNFEDMPFEEFLEANCDPVTMPYGSWFTNVKNWLRHRDDPNVLTVFYEDLKKDLVAGVTTVAEFIGRPVSEERAAEIAQLCGFTSMTTSGNMEKSFLRKGVIGDWKNHFTVAQSEMFDDVIEREMAGCDLPLQFE